MTITVKQNRLSESRKSYGIRIFYKNKWETIWVPKKLCAFSENYKLFEKGTEEVIDFPDWIYNSEIKKIEKKRSDYENKLKEIHERNK